MLAPLFIVFVILLVIGCPIAISLGVASMVSLVVNGSFDLVIVIQRMFTAVNSFPLMAIPFFMMAGSLMELGGISKRIIRFADAWIGHVTGGLAMVSILACMIFAAISGSAVATVAAIGGILVPEMRARGYGDGFSTAIVTAAGTTGPIIPPSTTFVLYASIAGVSITDMFIGGYIPGMMMGGVLMVLAFFTAKREHMPRGPRFTFREKMAVTRESLLALLAPVIIAVGIMAGICTPTEAGAVGCIYAFVIGTFVYKDLDLKKIYAALKESATSSAIIMYLIGTASIFSWILTVERVPQMVQNLFRGITDNPVILLLMVMVLLFVVGMILDSAPAITMLVPVLAPLVKSYGIDLVHFGVIMCVNLCIGLLTPPVGTCLFVGCRISKLTLPELVKYIWPMIIALIAVLLLCTFIPGLVTFLPNLIKSLNA